MIIAGIGSRKTPIHICYEMTLIGLWCQKNNVIIRSGHAEGADWAFECGAQESCEAFLPWENFNNDLKSNAKVIVVRPTKNLVEIVKKYHPNFFALSSIGLKFMCRNIFQIIGESNTDIVICWTPQGKLFGGTAFALRLAEKLKIPVLNMYNEEYNTASKVIDKLKELKCKI